MPKDKVIYSAITGEYDFVRELKIKLPEFDYILFTNNKDIKSDTWDVRYIEPDEEYLTNIELARQIKIQYWKYIPDYDLSIWVDGNIEISGDINYFLKTLPLDISDLFIGKHPHRKTIIEEAQTCIKLCKKGIDRIKDQIEAYKKEKMPFDKVPLVESGVIVRKDTTKIRKFCDLWYNQILIYSTRDQISFPYTLWKNPMAVFLFPAFRDHYRNVFTLGQKHDKLKV